MEAPGSCSHPGCDPTPGAPTTRGRWTQEGGFPTRSGCCRGWSQKCPLRVMDRRVFKPHNLSSCAESSTPSLPC